MAKLHNKTVIAALTAILASGRVTEVVGKPLIEQGLITVNDPLDVENDMAAVTLTDKGRAGMPAASTNTAPPNGGPSKFAIIDNAVLPPSKRGAGRVAGPPKYPFDDLAVGKSFFVPNSEVNGGNALKTLGSAVSNARNKYRVDTGRTEQVERTKRDGKKAAVDAAGNKIKETVTVKVYEYPRNFAIRAVKAGADYGGWKAPADGVLIGRDK